MKSWLGARAERAQTRFVAGLVTVAAVAASVAYIAGAPAEAASSVSPGSVTVNGNTAGATSTSYAVSFTPSTLGALGTGNTITFVAPAGTVFPPSSGSCSNGCAGYSIQAQNGTANITAVSANGNQVTMTVTLTDLLGLTPLSGTITVTIASVGNPTLASSTYTISESTSQDTAAVSTSQYSIVPDIPAKMTFVSGSPQSAVVASPYAQALVVNLVDQWGNPTPGQSVTFVAPTSGASAIFPGSPTNQSVASTDSLGNATSAVPTANHTAGTFSVTASFASLTQVKFNLDNLSGPLANLALVSGDKQSTDAGSQFAAPLQVRATDTYGNPKVNTPVVFTAPASGPSATFGGCGLGDPINQCTALTDSTGLATSVRPTANSSAGGPYTVTASASGKNQSFSLTNLIGPPGAVIPVSGSNQDALVYTSFRSPLQVRVTDSVGNPISGAVVTFSAPASGPTVTFAPCPGGNPAQNECVATTDGNGYASSSILTAGGTLGSFNIEAIVSGAPTGLFTMNIVDIGYRTVASDGGIFTFGGAPFYGSTGAIHLNAPIVGMANANGGGYYLVASDGGIFSFGPGATFYGSTGAIHLNAPVVGMAVDPQTGGYWLVASDGGVFSFNAPFWGSMGAQHLNAPIVGIAATPEGGYYLVASDGGIFSFGPGATFYGSAGGLTLNAPIVAMATAPDGGYWLVASDGGIFTFGPGAVYFGSAGDQHLNRPIVAMAVDPASGGYWLVASDGGIFSFGAPYDGSMGGTPLNAPMVGIAPSV
jgi:hypothetical protein